MDGGHICDRPNRISRLSCCHFVFLLNDTDKIPLCTEMSNDNSTGKPITFAPRTFTNSYSTPVYLNAPLDIPEDHVTFLFGIVLLISVAVFCVILIMKLTKPKLGFARLPSSLSFPNSMDYDLFLWLPRHSHRRSSLMLFLRSVACRPGGRTRQTSLSVVSNSSFGLLPTYRSAASTTSITPINILPPPPYQEFDALTTSQLTASTYVPDFERVSNSSSVRFSMPRSSDQNNNQFLPNNRRR